MLPSGGFQNYLLQQLRGIGGYNTEPLPQLLPSHDIAGVAKYILSEKCKRVSVLAGAGISVSAGIPDFRSKGGFYNTLDLSQFPLTEPQKRKCEQNNEYILTYELFKQNPAVYLTARREMILAPMQYHATLSHWFLKLLHVKGLLKRYYSTNIDGLDAQINLPDDLVCNVHGTLAKAYCIKCKALVDMDWFRKLVQAQKYPILCPKQHCNGYVKPNTVLFGESLPERYHQLTSTDKDLDDVDLFIVIGTSLAVSPSNYLPTYVDRKRCVRLLVNRDKVHIAFDFHDAQSNDIWLKGNCDDGFKQLTQLLGWGRDLYRILPDPLKEKNKELLLDSYNARSMADSKENDIEMDEEDEKKLSEKEQLIASLFGNTSFMNKFEIDQIWQDAFQGRTPSQRPCKILPVIHVQDPTKNAFETVWKSVNHNIHLVLKYNFDGILLINHGFMCKDLILIINRCREEYPKLWIGVNFLGCIGDELQYLIKRNLLSTVNGLWIENCGISFAAQSTQIIKHSKASDRLVKYRQIQRKWQQGNGLMFGEIEFDKSSSNVSEYDRLCKRLGAFASKGFMHCVCTSAARDDANKISFFKQGIQDRCKLAICQGITVENVAQYLGIADAIFLNKGLSDDDNFYNFNEFKMSRFRNTVEKYYENHRLGAMDLEMESNAVKPILSPVNEDANETRYKFHENDNGDGDKHDDNDNDDELNESDLLFQLYVSNANDVNDDLNGVYKVECEESKLPNMQHKTESVFTPNFMYYRRSVASNKEYGIFIIPSLEEMNIYKPTWVIAQINCDALQAPNALRLASYGQQPVYYYTSRVNFQQDYSMQVPSVNMSEWLIVGDDDASTAITMKLHILRLKTVDEQRRVFSGMHSKKNKQHMLQQMEFYKDKRAEKEKEKETEKEEEEEEKKEEKLVFDVDDRKISCVEMVGHNNILRVTEDIEELRREWSECELGNHDELEMFLGAIGKVIDVEEDDDTVKLEWSNNDCHWLPAKACWLKWNDRSVTAPNFYPDQDEDNDDTKLLNNAFGGNVPK